jgi:hypothetical protein
MKLKIREFLVLWKAKWKPNIMIVNDFLSVIYKFFIKLFVKEKNLLHSSWHYLHYFKVFLI